MSAARLPDSAFEARCSAAQSAMQAAELDALLLTQEAELRYYSGFLTRFWESPTRPWYLVLPIKGAPIAVIPAIGAHLMGQTWVRDIRTWPAPDYSDDGVSILADTLREVVPQGGRIGIAKHLESHVHMPMQAYEALATQLGGRAITDDARITHDLRQIKSPAEIAAIETTIAVATRAFDRVPEIARPGTPLSQVFRGFQALLLNEGADWVPYLAGAADQGGYFDVISPATDRGLEAGDVLMLDTGAIRAGYFCDFNRNWSLGTPSAELAEAHARLIAATAAGFDAARPGARFCDLYAAMEQVAALGPGFGRLGHGLGLQLTEGPSILPFDDTPLAPGMVITLEPSVRMASGRILVHEEDIVIEDSGARYLTRPQDAKMRVL